MYNTQPDCTRNNITTHMFSELFTLARSLNNAWIYLIVAIYNCNVFSEKRNMAV